MNGPNNINTIDFSVIMTQFLIVSILPEEKYILKVYPEY